MDSTSKDPVVSGSEGRQTSFAAGYDKGFFVRKALCEEALNESQFLLRVNAWAHLRHTYFNASGAGLDENQFEFERARLVFRGFAWTPDFEYLLQLDGDSDQETQVDLLDYFVTYDLGRDRLGWDGGRLRIRAGQWKVPFNRARQFSGRELSFADRSVASVLFDINRSVGVGALGRFGFINVPSQWRIAVINGFKSSAIRPAVQNGLDDRMAVCGRLSIDPMGDWGDGGISDLTWHDSVAARVGGGFAVTTIDTQRGAEDRALFAVDSGDSYEALLPAATEQFRASLFSVDVGVRNRGASLFLEYYFRRTDSFKGTALPSFFDHGFVLQSGYFLFPKKVEMLVRWSRVSGNSSSLGQVEQSADELAFGLGYYINGRNNKLVIDTTHNNGAPLRDSRLNYQPGDAGWTLRTQLQFGF